MHKFQRVRVMVRSGTTRRNAAHAHLCRWPAPAAAGDVTMQHWQQAVAAAIACYVRTARRQSASRYTATVPWGIILLITDKICTSERNLQQHIRGTLSRAAQKRSHSEMYKRKKRASASRQGGILPPPNYLPISWRKFEDCALDATFFFFILLLRLAILFKAKRLFSFAGDTTFQCALVLFSVPTPMSCFLLAGVVPERSSEVAANGDQAGKQDGGEVFARRLAGDGLVPWADGLHSVVAATQPSVQCDGGPAESELHGLPIAPVLRLISAVNLRSGVGIAISRLTLQLFRREMPWALCAVIC